MANENIYTEPGLASLARALAPRLTGGENIFLSGELGAGKTTFTQLLLTALQHSGPVTSPTFQIMNEYALPDGRTLVHIDLYRLNHPDDVALLGIHDYLAAPDHICVIEWPERGETTLPEPDLQLHFAHRSPTTRQVTVTEKKSAKQ